MKRVLFFILTFLILFSSNFSVLAASNTYYLDELELKITIPSGYSVITRDTPATDRLFNDLGTTKSEVMSQFETSNIYLNAVSDIYNEEIFVTNTKNNLTNFSLLSDTVLNTLASTLTNQYTLYGINVSKHELYQHSQAKFIKVYFTDIANSVHGLQYYTIYDGKAMNFTMRSYEGNISSRQENVIKTIVDSIKYDKAPPSSEEGEDTSSFVHTDTDSDTTFTVPANWKQEPLSKEREFIDVKFVSTKEDGCAIIYGSTDLWAKMSATEKIGYTRSDLNNSLFSKSDIAEEFNIPADKISVVTYNGIEYYKFENDYTYDTYSIDISLSLTQLFRYDNGWMYSFQFSGTSEHKLYPDFENLLNSVQFPTASNVSGITSNNNSDDSSSIIAVILAIVIIVAITIAAVIYKKKNAKTIEPIISTPIQNTPSSEPSNNIKTIIYCKNCGQALPLDSDFCHKCGTKIEKEI